MSTKLSRTIPTYLLVKVKLIFYVDDKSFSASEIITGVELEINKILREVIRRVESIILHIEKST